MKKIIIVFFLILISTGCYDYKELNNLAIVSGIAIDFDNNMNEYEITLEILNDDNNGEKIYFVSGYGKNISNAFNEVSLKITKIPSYSHVNVMIISKNIPKTEIKSLIDYSIRNSNMTNMFYVVLADNYLAKEILKSNNNQNTIISESIYQLINNKKLGSNLAINISFEEFSSLVLNPMQDLYIPTITLDNGLIKSNGIAIFKNNEFIKVLTYYETQAFEILSNKNHDAYYSYECENDKYIIIDIYKQKINYVIDNKNNYIYIKLNAKVVQNDCNYNLQSKKDIIYLNNIFNEIITNDVTNLVNNFKNYNADPLGIKYKYYKNYNKKLNYKNLNYKIRVNTKFDKNNSVIEVNK